MLVLLIPASHSDAGSPYNADLFSASLSLVIYAYKSELSIFAMV